VYENGKILKIPLLHLVGLELEGKMSGFFTNVGGIGSETEVIAHKIVNDKTGELLSNKIPQAALAGPLSPSTRCHQHIDIWEWRQKVVEGNG